MESISTHHSKVRFNRASACGEDITADFCRDATSPVMLATRSDDYLAKDNEVEEYGSFYNNAMVSRDATSFGTTPSFGVLIAGAVALVGVVLLKSTSWKHLRDSMSLMKHSRQIPCSRCRFFNQNPYMRCAVHPTKAQTSRAINCSDYWGYDNDEFRR